MTAPGPLPLGEEAAPLLAQLHASAFPLAEAWSADAIAVMLRLPGTFALLVHDEGEPAGFALARATADEAELLTIAVRPEARRRGHARMLLRGLAMEAAARGAAALFLEVSEANEAGRALYAALGAEQVGRRARYYADGSAAIVMRMELV